MTKQFELSKKEIRQLYNFMIRSNNLSRKMQIIEKNILALEESIFGDYFDKVSEEWQWKDSVVGSYSNAEFNFSFKEFVEKINEVIKLAGKELIEGKIE